jgi:HD-like signal output (HDOD) protein
MNTPFTEIVQRVETIPSPPQVVSQVVRLVNDPEASPAEIEAIMSKDVGMAAKVLRLVNSVYYGLDSPVHDLHQAIAILGGKTVRSIALSISAMNAFQQQDVGFSMKAYWTHCSVSAAIGRLIGKRCGLADPELPFVIGLFKDVGMLVLAQHAPEAMKATIARAKEKQLSFHQAAKELMGRDQAQLAARLCQRWEMEPEIVDTIRHQFDLKAAKDPRLVAIVLFSEYLCGLKRIRLVGNYDQLQLDEAVWTHLGLDRTALVDALAVVNEEIDHARQLLDLAYGS